MSDLAVRIVRARQHHVTILVGERLLGTIRQQIADQFREGEGGELYSLIR